MSAPDVVVAIQARTGSTRLPAKVLAELGGRPMLRFQLDRLQPVTCGTLLVATSTDPGDDAVADMCDEAGVQVFRGPESDVLGRYAALIEELGPGTVVRLTGDCPLADPAIVDLVADVHAREDADYTSNLFPRSYPKGLDVEVVRSSVLLEAAAKASAGSEREHVMPYVYRRPETYRMANVLSGHSLGEQWWTVDTQADLDMIRDIVNKLDDPVSAGWKEILQVVGATVQTQSDEVVLSVVGSSPTGSSPWVRTWSARRGRVDLGQARVSVGKGHTQRSFLPGPGGLTEADEIAVGEALAAILTHDEQIRL